MKPEYERYIREQFANASVKDDPFPHLVIKGVLPADLYNQMHRDCPTTLEAKLSELTVFWARPRRLGGFIPVPIPVKSGLQPMFALRTGNLTTPLLGRYAKRWQTKYRDYIDLVDQLTIEAYRPATARFMTRFHRAGFTSDERPLQIGQGLFTHRTETWRIPPHIHGAGQIIQSMIYFPLPGSRPEQGTVLYRLKGRKSVPAADLMETLEFADDEVEEAGMMPYHPNTLASFLNTPLSIHASPDVPGPARRYTFTAAVLGGVAAPGGTVDLHQAFG